MKDFVNLVTCFTSIYLNMQIIYICQKHLCTVILSLGYEKVNLSLDEEFLKYVSKKLLKI